MAQEIAVSLRIKAPSDAFQGKGVSGWYRIIPPAPTLEQTTDPLA